MCRVINGLVEAALVAQLFEFVVRVLEVDIKVTGYNNVGDSRVNSKMYRIFNGSMYMCRCIWGSVKYAEQGMFRKCNEFNPD